MALLAGAWLVGSAAGKAGDLPFAASARDSRVVAAVSASVPLDSDTLLASFATLVDRSGFPAVFSDAGLERIDPVPPADPAVLAAPGVRAASASLVKVLGSAPTCQRSLEGSGFVVAPGRVMTNAHVVAGTRSVEVYLADSAQPYDASVVVFDPRTTSRSSPSLISRRPRWPSGLSSSAVTTRSWPASPATVRCRRPRRACGARSVP